ncbi:hypothetical protein N9L68_06640 [bacterium]|nr:hypothetical protein [bacterium]
MNAAGLTRVGGDQPRNTASATRPINIEKEVPFRPIEIDIVVHDLACKHGESSVGRVIDRLRRCFAPVTTLAGVMLLGGESPSSTLTEIAEAYRVIPPLLSGFIAHEMHDEIFESHFRTTAAQGASLQPADAQADDPATPRLAPTGAC